MKTLHTAYRVFDLERSLSFYTLLGFRELGRVTASDGSVLAMLRLPGDEVVSLELVHDPRTESLIVGNGFSHIVVQVADLESMLSDLKNRDVIVDGPHQPGGPSGPTTSFLHDPDGYRIELVEWSAGHADGITEADFP